MSNELTWTTEHWTEQYELAVKFSFMKQSGCLWILSKWDLNNSALSLTQLRTEKHSSSSSSCFSWFLIMTDNLNSLVGGYSCLIIGMTGTLVNMVVLLVLSSERKLSSQPTTAVLVVITSLNILYNGLILPAQSLMYLQRRSLTQSWGHRIQLSPYLQCFLRPISLVSDVRLLFLRPHGQHPAGPVRPRSLSVPDCLYREQVNQVSLSLSPTLKVDAKDLQRPGLSSLSCQLSPSILLLDISSYRNLGEAWIYGGHW